MASYILKGFLLFNLEEHRKKVEEYKQKLAKMKRSEDEGPVKSEEDLWRRLDELELEEELQQELDL